VKNQAKAKKDPAAALPAKKKSPSKTKKPPGLGQMVL